jgi:DNA-binding transcriptional LysR family regulator
MDGTEPRWELLRSFLAVVEWKSLSEAARRLGITQPTVGRHIDALEAHFDFPLFVRSRYGLTPTEAALNLVPHVETMGSAARALLRTATGAPEDARGTVRITASEIVGMEILPELLQTFREKHSSIDVELAVTNESQNLLQRHADIAVRMFRPEQEALVARKIGDAPIGLYAHQRYVEQHGIPRSLDELWRHTLVGPDARIDILKQVNDLGLPATREHFTLRTDHEPTQLALVRAGAAIGGMQVKLAQREPELVRILPRRVQLPMEMWVVMHEDLRTSRRIRLLFDHLSQGLRQFVV